MLEHLKMPKPNLWYQKNLSLGKKGRVYRKIMYVLTLK